MVSQNLYFRDGNKLNLQPMEKSELYFVNKYLVWEVFFIS